MAHTHINSVTPIKPLFSSSEAIEKAKTVDQQLGLLAIQA